MTADRIASIHARLLNLAKERGEDFNMILTRYAIERFLYRLSIVPAREAFWLKGALLFDLWLGFGPANAEALEEVIEEVRRFITEPLKLARRGERTP